MSLAAFVLLRSQMDRDPVDAALAAPRPAMRLEALQRSRSRRWSAPDITARGVCHMILEHGRAAALALMFSLHGCIRELLALMWATTRRALAT